MFNPKRFYALPFFIIFFLVIPCISLAEETLTITTYYPSPYGVYREMRAKRIAIGDNYINHPDYTWEELDGDGGEVDYLADLVVEGNVGIGTVRPKAKQHNLITARSAAFSAADGSTWHDLIIQNPNNNLNAAVGLVFELNSSYHNNAGTGIAAVKSTASSDYGADLAFITRPQAATATEKMRITSAGNVGIGTTGPLYKLDVAGNIVNSNPSQGYIGLTGDLPGYAVSTYPTLKASGSYLYISVGGLYSAYVNTSGTWTAASDRAKRENFMPVDPQDILNKIDELPMMQWNFKDEDPSIRHIAPIAQDFHALFQLNGEDDKMISNIDPAGVALVGIKALSSKIKVQQGELERQQKQIEGQQLYIRQLKERLNSVEEKLKKSLK
jgi:hypothetical protein